MECLFRCGDDALTVPGPTPAMIAKGLVVIFSFGRCIMGYLE
jgi:hypothetical protein